MDKKIKAYFAAPIFTERDRNFNQLLADQILAKCPDLDLYMAQNNASINDKTGCANSADIYVGDVTRLKEADLLITIMSGDVPPIGSSYEVAYFCALCEQDPRKRIVALYDDCREATLTYSTAKEQAMLSGIAENQYPYINLLAVGYVKKWGYIYNTSKEFVDAVVRECNIGFDQIVSGIYKITNLKNNMVYIGQSRDIYNRWKSHKRCDKLEKFNSQLYADFQTMGLNYFKFEIIERCNESELDEKERYWINFYDSMNTGYNLQSGGSGNKQGFVNMQCIPIYEYDLCGNFVTKYESIAQASRSKGLKSYGDINRCALLKDSQHKSGGSMWRYEKVNHIQPYEAPSHGKKIYAYDINTRLFVQSYDNATVAGNILTGNRQPHITDVANGHRVSCCGFIWAYDYYERLPNNYFSTSIAKEGN